jgi:hypothetical protein
MSKVKIQGNASGTGVVTLTAPNTNTDRTITLPDSSDTLVSTAPSTSGNILTSDGTNWTSAAPAAAGADTSLSNLSATGENKVCQAWVNFNGTGTPSINDQHNVSSITDNATGKFTVNFSTAMSNTNYITLAYGTDSTSVNSSVRVVSMGGNTTSSFDVWTGNTTDFQNWYDLSVVYISVFGD